MSGGFQKSYLFKLGFYILVLALPLVMMALVETIAPDSAISVSSGDPTRFLAFIVYFLPGLILAKKTTDNWRRTLGVGVAYILISPAYYLGALRFACEYVGNCVTI